MGKRFAFRPALTMEGRELKGLRGWTGKWFHPPLTDVPIGAYTVAAILDLIAFVVDRTGLFEGTIDPRDLYVAAGLTMLTGAAVSVFTALTGFSDWLTTKRTSHVRKTANSHAWTMITMTVLVLVDLYVRFIADKEATAPSLLVLVLSEAVFLLLLIGATIGGSLVYDYGFNVQSTSPAPYEPEPGA